MPMLDEKTTTQPGPLQLLKGIVQLVGGLLLLGLSAYIFYKIFFG